MSENNKYKKGDKFLVKTDVPKHGGRPGYFQFMGSEKDNNGLLYLSSNPSLSNGVLDLFAVKVEDAIFIPTKSNEDDKQ